METTGETSYMATFRVNKNKNYTVMSNYHLRDKKLSLKAKGLLSQMLANSDDWGYSIAGLVAVNKENETAINSALKELKDNGYLVVTKLMPNQTGSGRYDYIYDIYELPQDAEKQGIEKQDLDFLPLEFLPLENQGLRNTNIRNTNIRNTKKEIYSTEPESDSVQYADVEAIILNDGSEWKPTVKQFDEYCRLYANVNVRQEFASMRGWCIGNPSRRKTKSGVTRFVTNWLSKAQNQGSRQCSRQSYGQGNGVVIPMPSYEKKSSETDRESLLERITEMQNNMTA